MPTYCFSDEDGCVIERTFPRDAIPESIFDSRHGRMTRDYRAENVQSVVAAVRDKPQGWPMTCVGSGVNANQAGELREHFKKHSVSVDVTSDGDPIYTSATHRRKALRCRGIRDNASFC